MQFGAVPGKFFDKWAGLTRPLALAENACVLVFTDVQPFYAKDLATVITYGTPYAGADGLGFFASNLHPLLRPGSDFLRFLNDLNEFPLPNDVEVINLIGRTSPLAGDDCVVSTSSQQQSGATGITRSWKRHATLGACPVQGFLRTPETEDVTGILEALNASVLQIQLGSPADVVVTDPQGLEIAKGYRGIWGASYEELQDENGKREDIVEIPFPVEGSYRIRVVPEPGAAPTDTFTLKTKLNGVVTVLARNIAIQDIPSTPFQISVAPDADGDGVLDSEDTCFGSDLSPTVVIGSCDSGIENNMLDVGSGFPGCTISDKINECAANAKNHGKFVSCVAKLTNTLKSNGEISGREKGRIQSCAAQASIGK
jgi:hypothetical protein